MSLHRIVRLALQCVLLYNVQLSKCDLNLPVAGGLCPTGEHDLEPCECISMGNKMAGLISIECGPSTNWTDMLEVAEMFNSVNEYPTTHGDRFNMTGTNVGGMYFAEVLGPLDFHQIIMDNNQIQGVIDLAFHSSASTLTLLSMKNNIMTSFDWDNLKELHHLNQLDLQGNHLPFLPTEGFPALEIAYLDLSRNYIRNVGAFAFSELNKLKKLDLSHNLLQSLDFFSFNIPNNYNSLQIILSNNQISDISMGAFTDVHPAIVDLSNNRLATVEEDAFMPLIISNFQDVSIVLTGNPIVCDCGIFWISDSNLERFFSNFGCYDNFGNPTGVTFDDLEPSFFDNCTKNTDKM